MWDSFQIPASNAENLSFIVFGTLACVCMPVYAYAGLEHVYTYAYLHVHALGFLLPLFSKNSFIQLIKELYFP